jgi:hypothetical protein
MNYAMPLLLILSGLVQYNDPDGVYWMFAYFLAAGALINHSVVISRAVIVLSVSYFVVVLAPQLLNERVNMEGVLDMIMNKEVGRESGGLAFICASLATVAFPKMPAFVLPVVTAVFATLIAVYVGFYYNAPGVNLPDHCHGAIEQIREEIKAQMFFS